MDGTIFRAYSIRGIVGKTLTVQDMTLIGQAVSTALSPAQISAAVVGHDYRASSPELATALVDGLSSSGMDVTDIGPCTTPLLNYTTDLYGTGVGIMVTASHNPPDHNGLKIRTDHTLGGEELQRIRRIARKGAFRRGSGVVGVASPVERYLDAICQRVTLARRLHLVVDAGNGAAGPIVLPLLARLGCDTTALYCKPDGRFPNRPPDPTAPGALDDLSERVISEQADAGLAYDGDGDRLVMVDETGRPVYADRLLALLAREALASHPGSRVVYELSCTQAVPDTVTGLGGTPISCPVGYAFVHETMRRTGAILGGETAGHIFFGDPEFRFDDAALATARMVALVAKSEKPLSALVAELPAYLSSPHHRLYCPDTAKGDAIGDARRQFVTQGYEVDELDGVKVSFGDGWGLLRASNTQPAITLRCEATTAARLAEIEGQMMDVARRALHSVGVDRMSDAR